MNVEKYKSYRKKKLCTEKHNIYALSLCITHNINPDKAMTLMGLFPKNNKKTLTNEDVKDMVEMRKKGIKLKEIGEMYNLSMDAVNKRIARYLQKNQ